jgi:cation diffusion facilitator CzcD-associated flavoprotein CzcO
MVQSDPTAALDGHVVVVGADNTTVRLVEELTRAGEHLVVVTPRAAPADLTCRWASASAEWSSSCSGWFSRPASQR